MNIELSTIFFLALSLTIQPILSLVLDAFPRKKLPKGLPAESLIWAFLRRPLSVKVAKNFAASLDPEKGTIRLYSPNWLLSADLDLAIFLHEIGHALLYLRLGQRLSILIDTVDRLLENLVFILGTILLEAFPKAETALVVAAACFFAQSWKAFPEIYASLYARKRMAYFLKKPTRKIDLFFSLAFLTYYDLTVASLLVYAFLMA